MNEDQEPAFRVWALLGARAGDNDQVLALAEALGLPFEIKQLRYNGLRRLGPRLLGKSLASLETDSRRLITREAPPDITISVGHRSVPIVRRLRAISRGRTRSIHIGFPRVSPGEFDLVIATPQYPNPDHANLLRVPFALTHFATRGRQEHPHNLATLPSPRRLLIVGGPTSYWRLDEGALRQRVRSLVDDARRGGSLMVTTSPRTPLGLRTEIAKCPEATGVKFALAAPGQQPTYAEMLAAADVILVTADSVAMVSDAIWTGKPLGILPLVPSMAGRTVGRVLDLLRPGSPRYPRDLRYFWRGLANLGLGEQPSLPNHSPDEWKARIVDRARSVIERR